MTQVVAPGADYTSRFSAGLSHTGLAGTIRFRLIDSDSTPDDPVYGPSADDIVEDPTGSGDYMITIEAPVTTGKYYPAWDLGSGQLYYDDDLVVGYTAQGATEPSGRDLCTLDDVISYIPAYDPNDTTDGKLQQLITAESDLIAVDTSRELIRQVSSVPRIFDIDYAAAVTGRVRIGDLTILHDATVVTVHDAVGTLAATADPDDLIGWYGPDRQATEIWEPVTTLEFRAARGAPLLRQGFEIRVTGTWGFPNIPTFIREGCAAAVVLRYLSDVAETGTDFAEAADTVNFGGLARRRDEAIERIRQPVFA